VILFFRRSRRVSSLSQKCELIDEGSENLHRE
jgi:hypothetical protein